MLPRGYNPQAYGGEIWWNENNPEMRAIWGTQEDYDNHIKNGGTWRQYHEMAMERMAVLEKANEVQVEDTNNKVR